MQAFSTCCTMVDMSKPNPHPHAMSADEALNTLFARVLPLHDVATCDTATSGELHGSVYVRRIGAGFAPTHVVYGKDGDSIGRGLSREAAMADAIVRTYEAERRAHAELRAAVTEWRYATSALMGPS